MKLVYVTGNAEKAKRFGKHIGQTIEQLSADIPEIQSLDIAEVIEHKAKTAFALAQSAVIVEDTALSFSALGTLPGTFIKFFLDSLSLPNLALLAQSGKATATCMFGYYDGTTLTTFVNHTAGSVAPAPRGDGGFGWDAIFIPKDLKKTLAELSTTEYETFYTETMKPFLELKNFLATHPSHNENQPLSF